MKVRTGGILQERQSISAYFVVAKGIVGRLKQILPLIVSYQVVYF